MSVEDTLPTIDDILDDPAAIESRLNALAATIDAVATAYTQQSDQLANAQIRSEELQAQLGALSAATSDLETLLAEKSKALADAETELAALRQSYATRSEEYEQLNAQLTEVAARTTAVDVVKAMQDERIRAVSERLVALLAEFDAEGVTTETEEAADSTDAEAAIDEKSAPESTTGDFDPIATLEANVDALAALLERKTVSLQAANTELGTLQERLATALSEKTELENYVTDAQNRAAGFQVEIANRSAELDALNEQIAALTAEVELRQTERQRLADALNQIAQRVGVAPADESPVENVESAGDEAAISEAADSSLDDQIAHTIAALNDLFAQFDSARAELEDAQTRAAAFQAELASRTAEIEALNEQVAAAAAASQMGEAERQRLAAALTAISQQIGAVAGEPVAIDATAEAESDATTPGAVRSTTVAFDAGDEASHTAARVAHLVAALESAREALDAAQNRVAELEEQLGALTAAKTDLEATISEKDNILLDLNARAAQLQQELADKTAAIDALNQKVGELETHLGEATHARDAAEAHLADLQQAKSNLEDQLGSISGELTNTQQRLSELERGLGDLSAVLAGDADVDADIVATDEAEWATRTAAAPLAAGGAAALIVAARQKNAALVEAQAEVEALRQQLADAEQARQELEQTRTELETQLAAAQESLQSLQGQVDDSVLAKSELEAQIETLTAELTATRRQIDELDQGLSALSAALDEDGDEADDAASERLAVAGVAAGGTAAVVAVARRQKLVLRKARAEIGALRLQLAETEQAKAALEQEKTAVEQAKAKIEQAKSDLEAQLAAAEQTNQELQAQLDKLQQAKLDADLSASVASQSAEIERLNSELAALTAARSDLEAQLATRNDELAEVQARYDALQTQLAQTTEEVQSVRAELQLRSAELERVQSQFSAATAWQQRAPAVVELGQSLSLMPDAKLSAANSAVAVRMLPRMVSAPQNLTDVKGIGRVFEQRLYKAGVGTFWELATLSDDDLKQILHLNELQLLHMDLDAIRADARRLAEETNTVGQIWDGEPPDDFEPIEGIGKIFEQRLYHAGIRKYSDLASKTPEELAAIVKPKPPAQPDFESWIEQARQLRERTEAKKAEE
jgi:chromosome segregation ATPase